MPTTTDRARPAWEPIAQGKMIASNIQADLNDAYYSVTLEQRVRHVQAAKDRYNALGDRIDKALKELGHNG